MNMMFIILSLFFLLGCSASAWAAEAEVSCPAPRSPDHGQAFLHQEGRVVKYACDRGYTLIGREIVRCVNGEWEQMPLCLSGDSDDIPPPVAPPSDDSSLNKRPLFAWGGEEEENSTDQAQADDARLRLVLRPRRRLVTSRIRAASELEEEERRRGGSQRTTIHLQAPPSVVYVRRTVSPGKSSSQENTLTEQYRTATVHMTVENDGDDKEQVAVATLPRQPVAQQNDKGDENLRHAYWLAQHYYPRSAASLVDYRSLYPLALTESQWAWINSLHPELRDRYLRDLYGLRRDEAVEGARSQAFLRRYEDVYYPAQYYVTEAAAYVARDILSTYDYSCNQAGHPFVRGPKLPNAHIARYDRRQNPNAPQNHYLTAVYQCNRGYTLLDSRFNELHCSRRQWVGTEPICVPTA